MPDPENLPPQGSEAPFPRVADLVFIPGGLALLLCAGLVCRAAMTLDHVEPIHLYGSGAWLAAMAVGLARGRSWAYGFGIVFFGIATLGLGSVAVVAGYATLTDSGGNDGIGVRRLVTGSAAIVAGIAGVLVAPIPIGLWFARKSVSGWPGIEGRLFSVGVGLAALGWLAWSLGYETAYHQLPQRNACLAGNGAQCAGLARAGWAFSLGERQAFGRAGCGFGAASSCAWLAGSLTNADVAISPNAQVLASACARGNALVCQQLGDHLVQIGDRGRGKTWLARACGVDPGTCRRAAESAIKQGEAAFGDELLARGCAREDPVSCSQLLRRSGPNLPDEERRRLQLKVCLLTDVNECLPLIHGDLRGVCPVICEGDTPNRLQSCERCARQAESEAAMDLAEAWYSANCQRGRQSSCVGLERIRHPTPLGSRASGPPR